jgi:hypothetical protein
MATVYSKRLFQTSSAKTVYEPVVPPGKVWVVKCIALWCRTGVATDSIGVGIGPTVYFLYVVRSQLPADGLLTWEGMQVANAGEFLRVNIGTGTWDVTISGYELTQ